jgi:cytoskeletal protein CcmA (bactofilin family)
MWKRPEDAASPPPPPGQPPALAAPTATSTVPSARPQGSFSRLGPSLSWEGKLSGEEDLLVEGRFRGEIQMPAHQVTIGSQGQIEGEVRASAIIVEGEVRGNLSAAQQVLVRASGRVMGDIRAPRVALDQGCRFKGAIDMEPKSAENRAAESRAVENGRAEANRREAEARAERPAETPVERPVEKLVEPPVEREPRRAEARR